MHIANSFRSSVGLTPFNLEVKGIPYYAVNDEGAIGVGSSGKIDFGSYGGGYSDNNFIRDFWSQQKEIGGNWYEGIYGVKDSWSVPLAQSLGIQGGSSSLVHVPVKDSQFGNPIEMYSGSNVGPYLAAGQGLGIDWLNGIFSANRGVSIPLLGIGANTGTKINFPSLSSAFPKLIT